MNVQPSKGLGRGVAVYFLRGHIGATRGIRSSAHDHNLYTAPRPRPVELTEEDVLPSAEGQLPVLNGDGLGRPDEPAFDVCGSVVVHAVVQPVVVFDDDLSQRGQKIGADARV